MICHASSKQVHQLRKGQLFWCLASDRYELTDQMKHLSVRETSAVGGACIGMSRICLTGRIHVGMQHLSAAHVGVGDLKSR